MAIRVPQAVSRISLPASHPPAPVAVQRGGPGRAVDSFEATPRRIPVGPPTLQRGSVGGQVTALQQRLYARGFLSAADIATGRGVFGPRTEAAVRRFQSSAQLPSSGVVGPSTYAALSTAKHVPSGVEGPAIHEVPTDRFSTAAVDARLQAARRESEPDMQDTLTDDFTEPVGLALAGVGV